MRQGSLALTHLSWVLRDRMPMVEAGHCVLSLHLNPGEEGDHGAVRGSEDITTQQNKMLCKTKCLWDQLSISMFSLLVFSFSIFCYRVMFVPFCFYSPSLLPHTHKHRCFVPTPVLHDFRPVFPCYPRRPLLTNLWRGHRDLTGGPC